MRTHSLYEVPCECGKIFEAEEKQGHCPHCHREYELKWGEPTKEERP